MAQENRPRATNAKPAQDVSAGSLKSAFSVSRPGVDLLAMSKRERECHLSGYLSGVLAGIDLGREQIYAEQAELHRRAWKIVQGMSKLLPWQEAEQARRGRQAEAAKSYRRAGQPWPLEVAS